MESRMQRRLLRMPQTQAQVLSSKLPRCPLPPVQVIDEFLDGATCKGLISQLTCTIYPNEERLPHEITCEAVLPETFDMKVPAVVEQRVNAALHRVSEELAELSLNAESSCKNTQDMRLLQGQYTSQSLPWHQDVSADGVVIEAEVAIVYLCGSGQLWIADKDDPQGESSEICVDILPGRLVSWCNKRYKHRVVAVEGDVRIAIGPMWHSSSRICQSKGPFHRPHCPKRHTCPARQCNCWRQRPWHGKVLGKGRVNAPIKGPPPVKSNHAKVKASGGGRVGAPLRGPPPAKSNHAKAKASGIGRGGILPNVGVRNRRAKGVSSKPSARVDARSETSIAMPIHSNPNRVEFPIRLAQTDGIAWDCRVCTFVNQKPLATICELCRSLRYGATTHAAPGPSPCAKSLVSGKHVRDVSFGTQTLGEQPPKKEQRLPSAKDIILQAGKQLQRSEDEILPYVKHIVDKEWYTTATHLKQISDVQWEQMRVETGMPRCLMAMIQNIVTDAFARDSNEDR